MDRLHPDPEATERERRELLEGLVASYLCGSRGSRRATDAARHPLSPCRTTIRPVPAVPLAPRQPDLSGLSSERHVTLAARSTSLPPSRRYCPEVANAVAGSVECHMT
jgi:hypothetical protein